jgi:hypothetical protein
MGLDTSNLSKQVAREAREILEAVIVESGPIVGRCSFCGRVARELTPVHDYSHAGQILHERYKCEVCSAPR